VDRPPLYGCECLSGSSNLGDNLLKTGMRKAVASVAPQRSRASAGVVIASSLEFRNISYRVGDADILDDISLVVEPGKVACLLGPSGSGKTSLLRLAAGLTDPTGGEIAIDGRVVASAHHAVPPEKRGIGLVFQDYALFPHLTIGENVAFGLRALSKGEAHSQALRMLARVGLEERANQYPTVLSGGEQQRVALARALAPRPGILLMDEPFSGLDTRLRDTIREQTLELLRETRSTAIIVTHDAEEALRVADKIALIRGGRLVQQGSAHDLYYNPCDLFTARFFSELNVLPAERRETGLETALGPIKCDVKNPCHVGIRHTDIEIVDYDKDIGVAGRIVSRRFVGVSEILEVRVEGLSAPLQIRLKTGKLSYDVSLVRVKADPKAVMIFEGEENLV